MKNIPNGHKKVPMMFRAQVPGRSQLQYIDPKRKKAGDPQDVELWADEWVDKAEFISAEAAQDKQTETYGAKSYQISWRFVTNGGQDEGLVRPVIGASGIPFYPGSSMKGAFRQACQQAEKVGDIPKGSCDHYCGDETEVTPGALRFLGAYPTNDWTQGLLDLVHPQQGWQVKTFDTHEKPRGESAYAQVSLYKPTLRFIISSPKALSTEQWEQIWKIWERAIASGLGSKVSTGYGQINQTSHPVIYRVKLKGQGQASKLIDDTGEFRPNIFRASLRGHALRVFAGLTDAETAEKLIEELFGGIRSKNSTVGLLGFQFQESKLEIKPFGSGKYAQPGYAVEGELTWFLTNTLSDPKKVLLKRLIAKLMQFSMIVGGFGKSWRRVDHRKFFEEYYEDRYKALIGCHWQWLEEDSQRSNVQVSRIEKVGDFFDSVRQVAREWIKVQDQPLQDINWAQNWREAWHPSNVQVWGRIAEDYDSSTAVRWFHGPYQIGIRGVQAEGSIYKSLLTGEVGQISRIGRIWHRMYPIVRLLKDPENPQKPIVKSTSRYLELLTIFSDDSNKENDFLDFLNTNASGFEQLWGDE
jgi:CRISPR-associated protein Cmr6